MDMNELKSDWQNASSPKHNEKELAAMTTVGKHPQLRRIQVKLVIESVFLILFLPTYYDALDGERRPLWLNLIFLASVLLYILNDVAGFINITQLTRGKSILDALKSLDTRLKKLKVFSLFTSTLFGLSLIAFLSSGITFTALKLAILAGILATMAILMYVSHRIWNQWIARISASIDGLEK
jgi:hypothetical protein